MLNQTAVDALYSATYVEDYLDSIENLPDDLQRQITRLRELDVVIQSLFHEVSESMSRLLELMRESNEIQNPEINRLQTRIQALLISCQELGDSKIHIGQEMQELIENKNRQLEVDRKNLESACRGMSERKDSGPAQQREERKRVRRIRPETFIPSVLGPSTLAPTLYNADGRGEPAVVESVTTAPRQAPTASPSHHRSAHSQESKTSAPVQSTNTSSTSQSHGSSTTHKERGKDTASAHNTTSGTLRKTEKRLLEQQPQPIKRPRRRRTSSAKQSEKTLNLPIDPDEPRYCLCDQVSYGEMIGCDNDLCPIEWFHFSCVSLVTKPKGKWFCPKCRGDKPNQMKPKNVFLKELEKYNREKEEKP